MHNLPCPDRVEVRTRSTRVLVSSRSNFGTWWNASPHQTTANAREAAPSQRTPATHYGHSQRIALPASSVTPNKIKMGRSNSRPPSTATMPALKTKLVVEAIRFARHAASVSDCSPLENCEVDNVIASTFVKPDNAATVQSPLAPKWSCAAAVPKRIAAYNAPRMSAACSRRNQTRPKAGG